MELKNTPEYKEALRIVNKSKMNNVPTAEELLNKNRHKKSTEESLIEFADLHREAIIKEIADDYFYYLEGDEGSEHLNKKKFFKEVYPLNNIK